MSDKPRICLFEDAGWRGLLPITWLHSPCELLFGAYTILQRIERVFPGVSIYFAGRPWIGPVMGERYGLESPPSGSRFLFINARLMDVAAVRDLALKDDDDFAAWNENTLIAARCSFPKEPVTGESFIRSIQEMKIPRIECVERTIDRWWDAIYTQEEFLGVDARDFSRDRDEYGPRNDTGVFLNPEAVFVSKTTQIDPGAVIDARKGPVIIDNDTHIGSGAILVGPLYIGPHCLVKPLSHIGPDVSLGPFSKVGGEVARSVFLGYANKQHYGFLGHAYISNWVNLGAGTTNSNLKNTYGNVHVWVDGGFEDSGKTFVGCAVGDHSKTAIGTTLNTGTVIGISCNVFEHGFPPKFIPSFSWGSTGVYDLEKALATAAQVMIRRNKALTHAENDLIRTVWSKRGRRRNAE